MNITLNENHDNTEIHADSIEKMISNLRPFLNDFLIERVSSKGENEKKEAFFNEFNNYTAEEKKLYRDYLIGILKEPENLNDVGDDSSQLNQLIGQMKNIDKYEICAGLYNNCRLDAMSNLIGNNTETGIETPNFIINSGSLSINGKKIDIGNLAQNYTGKGSYELFLDDFLDSETINSLKLREGIVGKLPKSIIIEKNQAFAIDDLGNYPLVFTKKQNKILITVPAFGIVIDLDYKKI